MTERQKIVEKARGRKFMDMCVMGSKTVLLFVCWLSDKHGSI
jgi:hypothetical protein